MIISIFLRNYHTFQKKEEFLEKLHLLIEKIQLFFCTFTVILLNGQLEQSYSHFIR